MNAVKSFSVALGDKDLIIETGKLATQAQGAALVKYGEQQILVTCGAGDGRPGMDFFPLVVEYEPRTYALGFLKHSKINKREGRKSDRDILSCRMIDRPLRPMFPKGTRSEVQIIATQLQTDGTQAPTALCMTAASVAIQLAGLPFEASVAGVHVGKDDEGNLVTYPTYDQLDNNGLDLIVAGTADAITMVEAGANLISNEEMLKALAYAHEEIKKLCAAQDAFMAQFDIEPLELKMAGESESADAAAAAFDAVVTEAELSEVRGVTKKEVKKKMKALEHKLEEACAMALEAEEFSKGDLMKVLDKRFAKNMRAGVFSTGKRVDGRAVNEVRPLYTEVGTLNRVHGCGFFQRGETQALSVLTLGGPDEELHVPDADRPEFKQRYMHHYNFPPFSVGETRMLRGPGRREIGHGALAERALKYVIPTADEGWAYTMRVVSEILACNGSSSMASVCGSTLALMHGGVPIKAPIAGIAMGLLMDADSGDYRILTDIQGLEDFDGDMDFKVTGNGENITCLQLDIKIKGLKLELLKEALEEAQVARKHILANMLETIAAPNDEMNEFAPLIEVMKVDTDDIRVVIGKGGETIQGLTADHDVKISIEDDGTVVITGLRENIKAARAAVEKLVYKPSVGDVFTDCMVKTIMDFGAFVEYVPGKDGLVHVSEIAQERVENVTDYLKEGQRVNVIIKEIDRQGRVKLSMKDTEQAS
jgi:polyribonucleotide nucleotidyltransferase